MRWLMRKKSVQTLHSLTLSRYLSVCSVTVYTHIELNKLYHMEFDTSIRKVIIPSKDALSVRKQFKRKLTSQTKHSVNESLLKSRSNKGDSMLEHF